MQIERAHHSICYCRDCQAYAQALGKADAVLDAQGGTEVVATLQQHVVFTQGADALACLSLSPRGLLRWHSGCCNTPIGNTKRDARIAFVGLVHNCLAHGPRSIDEAVGPVRMLANRQHARAPVAPMTLSTAAAVARLAARLAAARLSGSYRHTPFFVGTRLEAAAPIRVLSKSEREQAMHAVSSGGA